MGPGPLEAARKMAEGPPEPPSASGRPSSTAPLHQNESSASQPKAWYDEPTCLEFAKKRLPGITAEARRKGEERVLFCDNLHGQQTEEFRDVLWDKARTKLHLLPAGVTDLLQLVDAGFGHLLKHWLGEFLVEWMMLEGNLSKWTGKMHMWEKRVLLTHLAAQAMEKTCERYDFEKAGTNLGMLLTLDGTHDECIKIQGLPDYSFCDDDAGSDGEVLKMRLDRTRLMRNQESPTMMKSTSSKRRTGLKRTTLQKLMKQLLPLWKRQLLQWASRSCARSLQLGTTSLDRRCYSSG